AAAGGDDLAGFDRDLGRAIGDVETDEFAGEVGVFRAARDAEGYAEMRGAAAGGAGGHGSDVPVEGAVGANKFAGAAAPEEEGDAAVAKHFRFALIEDGAARDGPAALGHAAPVFDRG